MFPINARRPPPIVVVGAGIVGTCCALQLRREGHEVTLIDPHGPGGHASASNAGIITTAAVVPLATPELLRSVPRMFMDPLSPLAIPPRYAFAILPWLLRFFLNSRRCQVEKVSSTLAELTARSIASYESLITESHADDLVSRKGALYVYREDSAFKDARGARELRRRRGVKFEVLNRAEVLALEPSLKGIRYAVRYPDSRRTTNPQALVRRFASRFVELGGVLVRDQALGFRFDDMKLRAVLGREADYECSSVVIAAGAWSKHLARQLGDNVPLDTERGYIVDLPESGIQLQHSVIYEDRHIAVSPVSGGVRLAGMAEFGGLRTPANPQRVLKLTRGIRDLFPDVSTVNGQWWMSYRPSIPDSLPVIGRSSKCPSVLYAFGHGHVGLEFGALTGQLIANLVAHRDSGFDLRPIGPGRFRMRGITVPRSKQVQPKHVKAVPSVESSKANKL